MVQILLRVFGGRISLVFCSLSRVEIGWIDDGVWARQAMSTMAIIYWMRTMLCRCDLVLRSSCIILVLLPVYVWPCGISSSNFRDTAECK